MRVLRLIVHGRTRQPILLLGEIEGSRCLPIFLRPAQAEVISVGRRDGQENATSLPVDVLRPVVEALGSELRGAEITALDCGVFAAELVLDNGVRVAVKPSDALAVAVREGLSIGVADDVLDDVGQPTAELLGPDESGSLPPAEQLQEFRDFLDGVSPDDFRR